MAITELTNETGRKAWWNEQYARGKWKFLHKDREKVRLDFIARLVRDEVLAARIAPGGQTDLFANVIDLGSGEGLLAGYLDPDFVKGYAAVDISEIALASVGEGPFRIARVNASLAEFAASPETGLPPSGLTVIVASEVLNYDDDAVDWLEKIAAAIEGPVLVTVSCVGAHPDKPNWTADSRRLWARLERTGWPCLLREAVHADASPLHWDVAVLDPASCRSAHDPQHTGK